MRVAFIGAGGITELHARGLKAGGHSVVMVCDPDAARAARLAAQFGCPSTTDRAELLRQKTDLVTVAVPNAFHYEVAAAAVAAGHAVLCEKPLTRSSTESRKLVELAARSGKPLFVGYMKRTHPTVRWFLDEAAPRIGTPRSGTVRVYHPFPPHMWDHISQSLAKDPNSLKPTVFNDGVFVNGGSHMFDLLLQAAGPVKRVLAARLQYRPGTGKVDTAAHALLEMESGASVQIECGWLPLNGVGRRENGWDEVLELRGDEGLARLFTGWWDRPQTEVPVADLWHEPTQTLTQRNFGSVDYFAREYDWIEKALRGEKVPIATAQEAAQVDELIDAVFAVAT